MKKLHIDVKYSALYRPQSIGMLERQHRDIKTSLKASIEQMVGKHQNKWLDHLPFVLLGKRVSLQPDLGASPSELTFGTNVRIPGQILHDPGAPPTEQELHQILENVRTKTNRSAVQPSSHSKEKEPLPGLPTSVTHVYTRQHKAQGLQVPFEGPFRVVGRPSRSTVKLEVGQFKSGEKRFEIRHLNDIKAAHPQSLAAPAQRPTLGRPPRSTAQAELPQATDGQPSDMTPVPNPSNQLTDNRSKQTSSSTGRAPVASGSSNNHETSISDRQSPASNPRPARSTRNPNPYYVDAWSHKPWSASQAEIAALNQSISGSA